MGQKAVMRSSNSAPLPVRFINWAELCIYFARIDIRDRFAGSLLGPLWIPLATGIVVLALGGLYEDLLRPGQNNFLLYVAIGYVLWTFMSGSLLESADSLIRGKMFMKQTPLPVAVFPLRAVIKNLFALGYSSLVVIALFAWLHVLPGPQVLWAIPGFLLVLVVVAGAGIVLSILGARYRDLPELIHSILRVGFFVTPILWHTRSLARFGSLLLFNPFLHLIEIVRTPLLGEAVPLVSWLATGSMAALAWGLAAALVVTLGRRVVFYI